MIIWAKVVHVTQRCQFPQPRQPHQLPQHYVIDMKYSASNQIIGVEKYFGQRYLNKENIKSNELLLPYLLQAIL